MGLSCCESAGCGYYSHTGEKRKGGGGSLSGHFATVLGASSNGDASDFGHEFDSPSAGRISFPAVHDHCAHAGEIIGRTERRKASGDRGVAGYFRREGLTAFGVNPSGEVIFRDL